MAIAKEDFTTALPVPDPTDKTLALVEREIKNLEDRFQVRVDAMDKAVGIFADNLQRTPTEIDKRIAGLQALIFERFGIVAEQFSTVNEKFAGVQTQFEERDVRVEQTARDTKTAVDAALAAQEKAVGKQNDSSGLAIAKSEAATSKQIDQLMTLINAIRDNFESKLTDIKARQDRIEGTQTGVATTVQGRQAQTSGTAQMIGVAAAVVLGVASLIVTLVVAFTHFTK